MEDLYAGSGSFGLEALSRGAASALFVEKAPKALDTLRANIESLGLGGDLISGPVRQFLRSSDERFDLVFIDPPWSMPTEELEIDFADLDRLLNPGAEIVASRRHTDSVPVAPETWRVATDKRYGDTRILRYENETEER